jgi:hypothetical protein
MEITLEDDTFLGLEMQVMAVRVNVVIAATNVALVAN